MEQSLEKKKEILAKYNYPYEEFKKLEELRGIPIELYDDNITIEFDEFCSKELRNTTPLVTVWMITYNHEKYIAEAIEGVVNQKCDFPIELIIVEDHSSDSTLEICKEYQRRYPNIIHLFTPKERRPFVLAKVLKTSKYIDQVFRGKYLAFCEGDDYWTDNAKLQKQITVLEAEPNIGLCCVDYLVKDEETGELHSHEYFPRRSSNKYDIFGQDGFFPIQTAGVVVRMVNIRNACLNDFLYRCNLKMGDLQNFCYSVYPNGIFYAIPDVSYVYRRHVGGSSYGNTTYQLSIDVFLVRYYFMLKMHPEFDVDDVFCKYDICTFPYKFRLANEKIGQMELLKEEIRQVIKKTSHYPDDSLSVRQIQAGAASLVNVSEYQKVSLFIYKEMQLYGIPMLNKNICKSRMLRMLSKLLPYTWVSRIWRLRRIFIV